MTVKIIFRFSLFAKINLDKASSFRKKFFHCFLAIFTMKFKIRFFRGDFTNTGLICTTGQWLRSFSIRQHNKKMQFGNIEFQIATRQWLRYLFLSGNIIKKCSLEILNFRLPYMNTRFASLYYEKNAHLLIRFYSQTCKQFLYPICQSNRVRFAVFR